MSDAGDRDTPDIIIVADAVGVLEKLYSTSEESCQTLVSKSAELSPAMRSLFLGYAKARIKTVVDRLEGVLRELEKPQT
jgi:hypothetical protein